MSVQDVARQLPAVDLPRDPCRSPAVLEAIPSPEGAGRRHSLDVHWSESGLAKIVEQTGHPRR
ncbi:hypothetical protein [Streptomyces sp. NPDC052127]|uniref:hypothetical protein n=1 Tax=Streptomyces sp. NPDC052127 TaxID=3155679 RepID=UPI0034392566